MLAVFFLMLAGCRVPSLMPPAPLAVVQDHGVGERLYDFDKDGRADYIEQLGPDGRVAVLRFGVDSAEAPAPVVLDSLAPGERRQLFIALDSVPYELVRETWDRGRFRLFYPPVRVISPFPVMTDLCLSEFFGVSPCEGVEAVRFDGTKKTTGFYEYFARVNSPWVAKMDYYLPFTDHPGVYLQPDQGVNREFAGIEAALLGSRQPTLFGYVIGTSAIGSRFGRDGHVRALVKLDRFCQALMMRTHGRLQITMLSDHGHNLMDSRYIPLHEGLGAMGYHDSPTTAGLDDVVIPRYGPVTCAALYTRSPTQVAADAVGLEGVELAFFADGGEVVAVDRVGGRARIAQRDGRYRYVAESGDPLQLSGVLAALRSAGRADQDGFIGDRDLFDATAAHVFPDPLHRLWRAFHGLVACTPDVMLSLEDGYCYGTSFFNHFITMRAAHGNMRRRSSTAFAMTTAGRLPEVLRMEDLAGAFEALGLSPRGARPPIRSAKPGLELSAKTNN